MNNPVFQCINVSKCFKIYTQERTLFRLSKSILSKQPLKDELWALKDISIDIYRGDKIALFGHNGAGKTTLLRIITGILKPTQGITQGVLIPHPLFKYGVGLDSSLPVIDNIFLLGAFQGLSVAQIREKMAEIIEFAGLAEFLYVPVQKLSSGQKQRLLFSVFIQSDRNFLAFDESTSAADSSFRKKVDNYFHHLMNSDKTIIMSSHNTPFLRRYCNKALWLEHGKIKEAGNPATVAANYEKFSRRSKTAS